MKDEEGETPEMEVKAHSRKFLSKALSEKKAKGKKSESKKMSK